MLEESDVLSDLVTGVGSPGDVTLVVRDLPLAETTIGDLPERTLTGLSDCAREGIADVPLSEAPALIDPKVRPALPDTLERLINQLDDEVHDGDIFVHFRIDEAGNVAEMALLESLEGRDDSTVIEAPCETWQRIVDGRPAFAALAAGNLSIETGTLDLVRFGAIFQLFGTIAANVETTHLFASPPDTVADRVVDAGVRQPATLQRSVQRQASVTIDALTLF
ncbi:MAG: hypothetical protein ABEJ30_09190 [Halorientalis sp.]